MSIEFSSTTPAAPAGSENAHYQTDGTHFSFYFSKKLAKVAVSATGDISILADETFETATAGASDITRTLPDVVASEDRIVRVKKVDSGAGSVIVQGHGSPADAIDGGTTWTLSNQYQYVTLQSDGAIWHVIGNN